MQIEMEKMGYVEVKSAGVLMLLLAEYQEELGFENSFENTVISFNGSYGNTFAWSEWSSLCPYINMGSSVCLGINTPYAGIDIDLTEYKNKQDMIDSVKAEHKDLHDEDIEYLEDIDASIWDWIYKYIEYGNQLLSGIK